MNLVRSLGSANAWAVGRFDCAAHAIASAGNVLSQIPAITWFAASANVDGACAARCAWKARDDDSANSLRDVVRGFLALAKLSAGARPDCRR